MPHTLIKKAWKNHVKGLSVSEKKDVHSLHLQAEGVLGEDDVISIHANHASSLEDSVKSCGVPTSKGRKTLKSFQRFRGNYENLRLNEQYKLCRLASEQNWYVAWVTDVRFMYYGAGFRFKGNEAHQWSGMAKRAEDDKGDVADLRSVMYEDGTPESYDWTRVSDDVMKEYIMTEHALILFRVNTDGVLPYAEVLDTEDYEYECIYGKRKVERVKIQYRACQTFKEAYKKNAAEYEAQFGKARCEAMRDGKEFVVEKGADDEWDFHYICKGKSGKKHQPGMISIMDDLDYVELLKVGDWNGAWRRKNVMMMAKKGEKINSSDGRGRLGRATSTQLKKLTKALSSKNGNATFSVNHDTEVDYLTLAAEFFGDGIDKSVLRRLVNFGGFATMMLMEGFSQAHGVSPYMKSQLRAETEAARSVVIEMLEWVFNNPRFLGDELARTAPMLRCQYDQGVLYNTEEIIKRLEFGKREGVVSVKTVRESFGVDPYEEGERLRGEHQDRDSVTPSFESKAGLLPQLYPDDYPGDVAEPVGDGGEAGQGRPKTSNE